MHIYFVQSEADGAIKIGMSNNPLKRLSSLQSGSPATLHLLGIMKCGFKSYETEQQLHDKFKHLSIHGEWFRPGEDLIGFIAENAIEPPKNIPLNLDKAVASKVGRPLSAASRACMELIGMAEEIPPLPEQSDILLTIEQAASLLGVHQQTLRNWEKQGKIHPIRPATGGHRRYKQDEVNAIRKSLMSATEIVIPGIRVDKLFAGIQQVMTNFDPNQPVHISIRTDNVENKVVFSIDSQDGLSNVTKTFKMEE